MALIQEMNIKYYEFLIKNGSISDYGYKRNWMSKRNSSFLGYMNIKYYERLMNNSSISGYGYQIW